MTILKTYARLWADDLDRALPLLERLTGEQPHLRLTFEAVALAAIGDFLVVAGPVEERAKYAHASATAVVRDLDALQEILKAAGATLTTPATEGPTGRFLYARHADGAGVEYVEWNAELLGRLLAHTSEPPAE
ncbi:VOC family protein [Streptomyces sp. NPDC056529]|uniref:VOC family protein n=1 Tax=Streptomyces sp. NPDC056529 TaxID=3345855 RepID=UPI0036C72D29